MKTVSTQSQKHCDLKMINPVHQDKVPRRKMTPKPIAAQNGLQICITLRDKSCIICNKIYFPFTYTKQQSLQFCNELLQWETMTWNGGSELSYNSYLLMGMHALLL